MPSGRPSWLGVVCRIYAALLLAYPADFRARFREEMLQAFRDRCRDFPAGSGARGVLACALHMLKDLVFSAARERALAVHPGAVLALLLATAFGLLGAYLDFHTDEVQVAVLVLLVGAFVVALLRPAGAWRWALASGLCIYAAYQVGPGLGFIPRYPASPGNSATLLALAPAFMGAYMGVLVRHIARRTTAPEPGP